MYARSDFPVNSTAILCLMTQHKEQSSSKKKLIKMGQTTGLLGFIQSPIKTIKYICRTSK